MDETDDLPTVRTTASSCQDCGRQIVGSYHGGGGCDGLVVAVDGQLQCADCGTRIEPTARCPECGGTTTTDTTNVVVSHRPRCSAGEIESGLVERLQTNVVDDLVHDPDLSATARSHVDAVVEARYFGTGADRRSLSDRLEATTDNLLAYGLSTLEVYPDARDVDDVVANLCRSLSTENLDDPTYTHFGVGARPTPRGGVHVAAVGAKRSVRMPGELDPTELERTIHRETNRRRADHGIGQLASDHHLAGIARGHSRTMATNGFFAHTTPEGQTTSDRYERADYDGRRAGENIIKQPVAAGTSAGEVAADVVDGWMDSPGHRKNILKQAFEREGIGVYQAAEGPIFVTQNFG
ncbi:CAP domain-containing protein [Haloarcula sediminis]|uniref:CAP domain-containing protein n=1 Tax=Haloarcula sediminis TaxID=3111777 RepID=UPI002D77525A|nr:CAP domain-containing protein [Haloarcula sp. CK38]